MAIIRHFLTTKRTPLLSLITLTGAPLYVIRWEYFAHFPTTLLEFFIWLTIVSWLFDLSQQARLELKIDTGAKLAIGFFFLTSILALFPSDFSWQAIGIWRAYFLEPFVFFVILIDLLNKQRLKTDSVFSAVVLSAVGLGLLGLSQALLDWPVITPDQANRAHAVFNNGNALALFIGPVLAVLGARVIGRKSLGLKRGVFILILGSAFVATFSLGGLIALGVALVANWLIVRFGFKNLNRYFYLAGLLVCFIFLTQVAKLAPETSNPWVRSGGTAKIRLCVWEGSVNLARDNFFWGAGLTGFQKLYSNKYITCDAEPLVYPHNFFLNFWTETGLLGLLAVIYLFLNVYRKASIEIQAFFTYTWLHGMVDVPYFKNDLALVFWGMLAVAFYSAESSLSTSLEES